MKIIIYREELKKKWNDYVLRSTQATNYHQLGWKEVVEDAFGHKPFYFMAMEEDKVVGVFPIVFINTLLFGRYMVSLPFFNYGGICYDTEEARYALLEEAIKVARLEKVKHIEVRDTREIDLGLPVKKSKVSMFLDLPDDFEELWKTFKSKLRSQIRRPEKEGMKARIGGIDELDNFYKVFSINMRDLGTPVYPKDFFKKILTVFPGTTAILIIYLRDLPIAAAFLSGFKDTLEVPWASSLKAYNHASPNMLLYWNILKYACEKGYKRFDFGRSSPDSGTFHFKKQWGAVPAQLYWYYWLTDSRMLPELNPQNKRFTFAIKTWQKLPVWLTKLVGPHIVRGLPS